MTSDPNRKSARTFQCRDVLWDTFEQMARELECSVDYLINESMKQYARQRSYGSRTPYPGNSVSAPPGNSNANASAARRAIGSVLPPPPARPRGGPPPLASRGPSAPVPPAASTLPPAAGRNPAPAYYDSHAPAAGGRGRSVPPPVPSRPPPGFGNAQPQQGQLSLICNNEKVAVNKDRFIIGRGKQSSDYTLKDPNVSRQHAMIEYQNGSYFFVDMGSTNGIEFNGQRVARKQINEGDLFKICDHELRFTYR